MSFLGFGRRADPAVDRQKRAINDIAGAFDDLEQRFSTLPDLRRSFANVWQDSTAIQEFQQMLPAMKELIGVLRSRTEQATAHLPKFDEHITMLAAEIERGRALLVDLSVYLVTKQALKNSDQQ